MIKTTILSTLLVSSFAMAGELSNKAANLKQTADRIERLAQRIDYGSTRARARARLITNLDNVIQEAREMKRLLRASSPRPRPRPNPRPAPMPGPLDPVYTAECHIDDDPDFTYDQQVVNVRGATIALLIDNCNQMAEAMHPSKNHSSGLKRLQMTGSVPYGMQTGICHIDDDPQMTFDQIVLGTIAGRSMAEITADCKMIANAAYGLKGSSGLKKVNVGIIPPANMVSGTCHIDDDPDMTFDQFIPGIVFGYSIRAISEDCRQLAADAFGTNGTSGLRNIQQ